MVDSRRKSWLVLFTLTVGFGGFSYSEEIVFVGSMAIVLFLMVGLCESWSRTKRSRWSATAVGVFISGRFLEPGRDDLWMIGPAQIRSAVPLRPLADRQHAYLGWHVRLSALHGRAVDAYVVGFLTVIGTILTLPIVSMFYGLHEWTASITGGVVDARSLRWFDTALNRRSVRSR